MNHFGKVTVKVLPGPEWLAQSTVPRDSAIQFRRSSKVAQKGRWSRLVTGEPAMGVAAAFGPKVL
jgi:hypothetical protein